MDINVSLLPEMLPELGRPSALNSLTSKGEGEFEKGRERQGQEERHAKRERERETPVRVCENGAQTNFPTMQAVCSGFAFKGGFSKSFS